MIDIDVPDCRVKDIRVRELDALGIVSVEVHDTSYSLIDYTVSYIYVLNYTASVCIGLYLQNICGTAATRLIAFCEHILDTARAQPNALANNWVWPGVG